MTKQSYHRYWAKSGDEDSLDCHLLPYHLMDVAACMEALLEEWPALRDHLARLIGLEPQSATAVLSWLAGLHDAGKFSEAFQGLRPDIQRSLGAEPRSYGYHLRHDTLGRELIGRHLLGKRGGRDWLGLSDLISGKRRQRQQLAPITEAIACHHGQPGDRPGSGQLRQSFVDHDYRAFQDFAADLYELLDVQPRWALDGTALKERFRTASWQLAGWTVFVDWIGSNQTRFPMEREIMTLEDYWDRARDRAQEAIAKSGVGLPQISEYTGLQSLFRSFDAPSPLQAFASTVEIHDGPQLFILEDATGAGKTEASLILANRLMNRGQGQGFYIGLPTTATANGMYQRMSVAYHQFFEQYEEASLVLAHSTRHLMKSFLESVDDPTTGGPRTYSSHQRDETAQAICSAWLSDHSKKALLAPFGVGTIDQALLAGLPSRHQCLRLAGLSQKILIVDEIHAYDTYMQELLRNLLHYHVEQGGSAILLSATLPHEQRQALVDTFADARNLERVELQERGFPLTTHCGRSITEYPIDDQSKPGQPELRAQKTHDVDLRLEPDRERCVQRLIEAAEDGQCACWIRNTVDDAIEAYETLTQRLSRDRVTLFHARFCRHDRQRIEDQVLEQFGKDSTEDQRAGRVVIATQVIEQSLDLDFDVMVTDLAPIDLVIQRAGRMHRHERSYRHTSPELIVHSPLPEPGDAVTADWYADTFPRAQWVYKDHGQLWLTAKALQQWGRIAIPDLARDLVEFVYSPSSEELVPLALEDSSFESIAEEIEQENLASFNQLKFHKGYVDAASPRWFEDVHTPTRLGDPSITLRLARTQSADTLEPWSSADHRPWDRSELSIRASKVQRLANDLPISSTSLEAARQSAPDRCKWSTLVPLSPDPNHSDRWSCPVINHRDEIQTLIYDATLGLRFSKEDA